MEQGKKATAVLISIRPEWCEKIISGEKTVEVRKTRPKIDPPFMCYIYCTRPKYDHEDHFVVNAGTENAFSFYGGGKVIGECVCDFIERYVKFGFDLKNRIYRVLSKNGYPFPLDYAPLCLSQQQLDEYGRGRGLYGWHISDLRIYEKPLALKEFSVSKTMRCNGGEMETFSCRLQDPPRSWCYVDERSFKIHV